jgi:hypothetical protein
VCVCVCVDLLGWPTTRDVGFFGREGGLRCESEGGGGGRWVGGGGRRLGCFVMKRDGGKRNKGEEPDLCSTVHSPPLRLFLGLQPVRFRSTYGIPRVRMQHFEAWKEGWKDVAGILHEFHHERMLGKVGLICVWLTVGNREDVGKGARGFIALHSEVWGGGGGGS